MGAGHLELVYYLKTSVKNLIRNKTLNILRLSGLVTGLAVIIVIALYVINETSYDKYHDKKGNIFLVSEYWPDHEIQYPITSYRLGTDIEDQIPQIKEVCRVMPIRPQIKINDSWERPSRMYWTEENVFNVFTVPFIHGNPQTALKDPASIAISESAAIKFFSTADCIGEMLQFKIGENLHELYVSGVFEDLPRTSTLRFRYLVSQDAILNSIADQFEDKYNRNIITDVIPSMNRFLTYILKSDNSSLEDIKHNLKKIEQQPVFKEHDLSFNVTNLTDLYFESVNWTWNRFPAGDKDKVGIYQLIAIIIALIVCLNYILVSIVVDSKKAKEIGIRKLYGASRGDIIWQNLLVGVLLVLLALPLALIAAELIIPFFNLQFQSKIELQWLLSSKYLLITIGVVIVIGFLSGAYTGVYIANINPFALLRSLTSFQSGKKGILVGLFLLQLFICMSLITAAIVVNRQSQYFYTNDMGFKKDGLIELYLNYKESEKYPAFKNHLLTFSQIDDVTGSLHRLLSSTRSIALMAIDEQPDIKQSLECFSVDFDFIKTLGITLLDGRDFSKDFEDEGWSVLVNQKLVDDFGLTDPIGKKFDDSAIIIGVVDNFNFHSMNEEVSSLLISLNNKYVSSIIVRAKPQNIESTISILENEWDKFFPITPFNYLVYDDIIRSTYPTEFNFNRLTKIFTLITLIITCSGLWGISVAISNRRRREVCIRKIMGASAIQNFILLIKDYFLYMLIAFFVSIPIIYIMMNKWLEQFAYRIEIGLGDYLLTLVLTISILMITLGYSIYKTVVTNPARILRDE